MVENGRGIDLRDPGVIEELVQNGRTPHLTHVTQFKDGTSRDITFIHVAGEILRSSANRQTQEGTRAWIVCQEEGRALEALTQQVIKRRKLNSRSNFGRRAVTSFSRAITLFNRTINH